MSEYARWAALTNRQKMMAALSGQAHPTVGLEVSDGRTGTQLGIHALRGLGADASVRTLRTYDGNTVVSMRESGGIIQPTAESETYAPVTVTETPAEAPVVNMPTRTLTFDNPKRMVPNGVYATNPLPAVQTTDSDDGYTFATGREGGAPDVYPSEESDEPQYTYADYEQKEVKPVEQYRNENSIYQTADMVTAAQAAAASNSNVLDQLKGWWATAPQTTKLLVGAAVLGGGYLFLKK